MHGQCDNRPIVTFPAIRHHRPLTVAINTAWWLRHMCKNLPKIATWKWNNETCNLRAGSPNHYNTRPRHAFLLTADLPASVMPSLITSKTYSVISMLLLPAEALRAPACQSWWTCQSQAVPECCRHSAVQQWEQMRPEIGTVLHREELSEKATTVVINTMQKALRKWVHWLTNCSWACWIFSFKIKSKLEN